MNSAGQYTPNLPHEVDARVASIVAGDDAANGSSHDASPEDLSEAPAEGASQPLLQPYTMGDFKLSTRMVSHTGIVC